MMMLRKICTALARPILYAHRRQVKLSRQAGFALVVVTSTVSILSAVVAEFGYNARVEMESAANARDQLRAEYLARSGINLSRLLIKVQSGVIDKINGQFKMDIQIADFAPFLMKAFGGEDGAETLGALLGIGGTGSIKGLGVGKGATFDVALVPEDGKINVNCAGGMNPGGNQAPLPAGVTSNAQPTIQTRPQALYALLTALMFSPRYNRLFENPDSDGQYATREVVSRAIIDWSDVDESRFEESGASGNAEDYRYDGIRDPYKSHNHFFDTVDEVQLVQGVGDDFWGAFGEMFTVYGGCKINLNAVRPENWPITAAIIRTAAKDRRNPVLLDDTMIAALAQQISALAQMMGGIQGTEGFAAAALNGGMPPITDPKGGQTSNNTLQAIPGMQPVELNKATLALIATTGPRKVYRVDSTGSIKRAGSKKIEVHIRAVFDTEHFNQNVTTIDPNDRKGTWVYWRMD